MLPFQLIYTGKTEGSLPDFCLAFIQKHWSNDTQPICLIEYLLFPYIEKVKEEKVLPQPQKSCYCGMPLRSYQLQRIHYQVMV